MATTKVKASSRRTKSGKRVNVRSYERNYWKSQTMHTHVLQQKQKLEKLKWLKEDRRGLQKGDEDYRGAGTPSAFKVRIEAAKAKYNKMYDAYKSFTKKNKIKRQKIDTSYL